MPDKVKNEQKQGFLGLGLKPGESLPQLEEGQKPLYRVTEEGVVEWRVRDPEIAWLEATYELKQYVFRKFDWVSQMIFRGHALFSRALMGFPVRLNHRGWPLPQMPVYDHPLQIPSEWETAPMNVQETALRGAFEYLKPELEEKARREAEAEALRDVQRQQNVVT